LLQLLIITVGNFVIKYATGFALQHIIGQCPWHYKIGNHLHGLIRFNYAPAWMLFANLLLAFYKWVNAIKFVEENAIV